MVCLHGVLVSILLDRDFRLIYRFLIAFQALRIKLTLNITYHSKLMIKVKGSSKPYKINSEPFGRKGKLG